MFEEVTPYPGHLLRLIGQVHIRQVGTLRPDGRCHLFVRQLIPLQPTLKIELVDRVEDVFVDELSPQEKGFTNGCVAEPVVKGPRIPLVLG